MDIKLREYQQPLYDAIKNKLLNENVRKLCAVLPTGGGKSVVIGKLANELPGRTLILTHRIEILTQNEEWLKDVSVLTAKRNSLKYNSKIVISMVQTAYSRIERYGISYLGKFDNIILDEVQILIFEKVFEKYDFKHLIGFTATPVLNKKKYTTIDGVEYVEPFTLSEIFDDIVEGIDSQDLIDLGYLVQDYNVVLKLPDFDKLKESDSSPDGYTKQSLNEVYTNQASLKVLDDAYNKYCIGKKTLIFNATTAVNEVVFKFFKDKGLNVKMFDSVNDAEINEETGNKYTRDEIIEWFNNERDAVLINTNVFTTGFNVPDVECVIVNRATKSLSLWIQMVGRGSRTTNKIFKDFFTVIDLGQNIHTHGIWSLDRNWKDYFYSPGKKLKNNKDMLDTWDCKNCGSINIKGEIECAYCGAKKTDAVIKEGKKEKKKKDGELVEIKDIPLPKGHRIVKYCKDIGEDANFAFKLAERKIVELFIHYRVKKSFYEKRKDDFHKRVVDIYRPIYFTIIKSDLKGANKTLKKQIERLITKIDKHYDNN